MYLPYEAYTGAAAAPLDRLLGLRLPRGCFVESALATLALADSFGSAVCCWHSSTREHRLYCTQSAAAVPIAPARPPDT